MAGLQGLVEQSGDRGKKGADPVAALPAGHHHERDQSQGFTVFYRFFTPVHQSRKGAYLPAADTAGGDLRRHHHYRLRFHQPGCRGHRAVDQPF